MWRGRFSFYSKRLILLGPGEPVDAVCHCALFRHTKQFLQTPGLSNFCRLFLFLPLLPELGWLVGVRVRVVSCFRTWLRAATAVAAAGPRLPTPRWPRGGPARHRLGNCRGQLLMNCRAALLPAGGETAVVVAVPPDAGEGVHVRLLGILVSELLCSYNAGLRRGQKINICSLCCFPSGCLLLSCFWNLSAKSLLRKTI